MSEEEATQWGRITRDRVLFLSFVGSVASIAALVITLLDKFSLNQTLDPQLAAWRAIGFAVCLLLIGATVAVWYVWAIPAFNNEKLTPAWRIIVGTWRTVVCLFFIGAWWDGLNAALYWRVWMFQFFHEFGLLTKQLILLIFTGQ